MLYREINKGVTNHRERISVFAGSDTLVHKSILALGFIVNSSMVK